MLAEIIWNQNTLAVAGVFGVPICAILGTFWAGSPWEKSRALVCRGIELGSRRRDDAVLTEIRTSLDNEEPGPITQTAAARLLPLAA